MYRPTTTAPSSSSSGHPMYGPPPSSTSLYPKINQQSGGSHSFGHLTGHASNFHHSPLSSCELNISNYSPTAGIGIRVAINPDYRITPPPQLSPQIGDIPRSIFQFDFDFERKILAEAEKESQNWSRLGLENIPSKVVDTSPVGSTSDPLLSKYVASGLNREAVPLAVANYGDNPTKVKEFVKGYTLLLDMGFPSNNVAEALLMYDNDTDKALAHFLKS